MYELIRRLRVVTMYTGVTGQPTPIKDTIKTPLIGKLRHHNRVPVSGICLPCP